MFAAANFPSRAAVGDARLDMSFASCSTNDDCATQTVDSYCAALANSTSMGTCRPCADCSLFSDAVELVCPERCDDESASANVTASVFFGEFPYWSNVYASASSDLIPKGCLSSASARTRSAGKAKFRPRGCLPLTHPPADKWCDSSKLTRVYPFASCIASEATNYCGTGVKEFCIETTYWKCCAGEAGAIAGVITGISVFIIVVGFVLISHCYKRKVMKLKTAGVVVVSAFGWKQKTAARREARLAQQQEKLERKQSKLESKKSTVVEITRVPHTQAPATGSENV